MRKFRSYFVSETTRPVEKLIGCLFGDHLRPTLVWFQDEILRKSGHSYQNCSLDSPSLGFFQHVPMARRATADG